MAGELASLVTYVKEPTINNFQVVMNRNTYKFSFYFSDFLKIKK